MAKKTSLIKVAELFAGVGGFREAIENSNKEGPDGLFKVVWSNQWEPSESAKEGEDQFANRVYMAKFKEGVHFADDIHKVSGLKKVSSIKKVFPPIDMLVGGFPCQDYSVAKPKNVSKGLRGPKGVLWWSIDRLLDVRKPKFVLLENVDRLINSPAGNRGRDFAIILFRLRALKYAVEWRVVNAADYGFPQKRRRIFILAYKSDTVPGRLMKSLAENPRDLIERRGVLARALPCDVADASGSSYNFKKYPNQQSLQKGYREKVSPFLAAGMMFDGVASSWRITPEGPLKFQTLRSVIHTVAPYVKGDMSKFMISSRKEVDSWAYAKGRKNEPRRKLGALVSYLEGIPSISGKVSNAVLLDAARGVPSALRMDFDFLYEHDGASKPVRIAREELNFKVADLLGLKPDALRPSHVSRQQVIQVLRDSASRAKLETFTSCILADRVISLFAIKDKAEQEEVRKRMAVRAAEAVSELLADGFKKKYPIGETFIELDRDVVSGASFAYGYKEGGMAFPDSLDNAGRTIITSEGGASVSRFKHVICDDCAKAEFNVHKDCAKQGKLRRLYPRELEAMNGFSLSHSEACEKLKISDGRRAFFMGNALVVGVVERILKALVS
jgi:DNA (cytosine-5)-methyltransferase 1